MNGQLRPSGPYNGRMGDLSALWAQITVYIHIYSLYLQDFIHQSWALHFLAAFLGLAAFFLGVFLAAGFLAFFAFLGFLALASSPNRKLPEAPVPLACFRVFLATP